MEWQTSPSWYWAWTCDSQFLSWPLKLSWWNSLVMTDRDFPLVSGRNRPTYRADNRQTAPKGTKQYSLNSLCQRKATESCKSDARYDINVLKCLIVCIHLQIKGCMCVSHVWIKISRNSKGLILMRINKTSIFKSICQTTNWTRNKVISILTESLFSSLILLNLRLWGAL